MSDNSGIINTGAGATINIGNRNVFGYQPRVTYVAPSAPERELLESVRTHVAADTIERKHDIFLSHASADLSSARILYRALKERGADVWMDTFSLRPGQNFVRGIDRGISLSRIGVVLVTPTVISGRKWVEREFSALLVDKETIIPILDKVTSSELQAYSPLLNLKNSLSTASHSFEEIADLIVGILEPR